MEQKCPNCNGGGVIKEYDELDRYHVLECGQCGGGGVINTNELKPCPFCGGEAREDETILKHGTTYSVYCDDCGAEITRFNIKEAIEAWNRRAEE
jgi:Lar family restriction alleviation protein